MRRRVAADARLPVAILLPVPLPSSPSPQSTVTILVLVAILFFTVVNCSADGTETTGNSKTFDEVSEASETTSGNRVTSTNFDNVVASLEVRLKTTSKNVKQFTPVDTDLEENNQFMQTSASMSTRSPRRTVNNRRFRSNTVAEVAIDNTYVSTWSRLHRREKAISATSSSSFLTSTTSSDLELLTTSQPLNDVRHSATAENILSADKVLDVSSKTTSGEDLTTTATTFYERNHVKGTFDVTSAAANVEVLLDETTQKNSKSAVEVTLDRLGGGIDSFDVEHLTNSISLDSNTWHDVAPQRFSPSTKATSRSTSNRSTSRVGERKRCLQIRTGGGDSPAMDCYQDRVVDGDDIPSGTTNRRHLEFCDAYSVYVADFDCAPSSSCLDFLCPEIVRLDRLAQLMNDQFIDRILNYDCDNRYSIVWNCSACKVTSSL